MKKRFLKNGGGLVLLCLVTLMYVSCGSKEEFTQQATTNFFTQDYNPSYLDVLWMIDDRSPMSRIHDHLVSEASSFFARLDAMTDVDYRMAFVSADMEYSRGALKPSGDPIILTKGVGTVDQRAALFGSIVSQIINLQTGYADEGLESSRMALTNAFQPRANVPLVLVTISDSDDHSPLSNNTDAVSYYSSAFLGMKGNQANLLRIYSVNYEPGTPTDQNRCATRYDADIDQPGFQNRYFNLATKTGGSTADLCGSFSSQIDLTGLKLRQLPSTFLLSQPANPSTVTVAVTANGQAYNLSWSFDAASNQIVFTAPPPEGSTIQVSYYPQNSSSSSGK